MLLKAIFTPQEEVMISILKLTFWDPLSIEQADLNIATYDCVIFCQGLNPSKNLNESDYEHFTNMYGVNVAGPSQVLKKIIPTLSKHANVLFFGSIATKKGSYDPAYAASKSALKGFIASLSKAYKHIRFNSITLGLVEGSPVFEGMTGDFRQRHADNMYNNQLIKIENVVNLMDEIIQNTNINKADFLLDGGYQV